MVCLCEKELKFLCYFLIDQILWIEKSIVDVEIACTCPLQVDFLRATLNEIKKIFAMFSESSIANFLI